MVDLTLIGWIFAIFLFIAILYYFSESKTKKSGIYDGSSEKDQMLQYDIKNSDISEESHVNVKYCTTCDILIDRNVNYCHQCGTKLTDVAMSHDINKKEESEVVIKNYRICGNCNKAYNTKNLRQCGPCGDLFCNNCWENHRWCHGKPPSLKIWY